MKVNKTYFYRLPSQQGNLDGLCGVYSIINALSLLKPNLIKSKAERLELMSELCSSLDAEGRLLSAIVDGIDYKVLCRLIDSCSQFLTQRTGETMTRRAAFRRKNVGLGVYWSAIQEHVAHNGEGSVIVGMEGVYSHWTCVRTISPHSIALADSDKIYRIRRSRCTTSERFSEGIRHHWLWPTQTIMLQVELS